MFKTNLSLLALAFVIAVSSAQVSYYGNSNGVPVPVDEIVYQPGYTVHKEVHTYNHVQEQDGNKGGRGNTGGSSGGGLFGGGGIFNLASDIFKTTLATGAGMISGAAGAVLGGTNGASHLANTAANMVYRS